MQREALLDIFSFCKDLYNATLEQRIQFYKKYKEYNKSVKKSERKYLSYNQQQNEIAGIEKSIPEAKNVHSQTRQDIVRRIDLAYKAFFRRIKLVEQGKLKPGKAGFPRFKSIKSFRSISFTQCDLIRGGVKLLPNNKLKIKGVPDSVKVIWHREYTGNCKQVQIVKHNDQYFVQLICENIPKVNRQSTGESVGIDLGINSFIMQDDGTEFHHPKPYKTSKEKLAYMQKKLANKQKGSNNRNRLSKRIAKQHQKIANVRADFQHKTANKLIKKYDKIIIEDLNIKNMLEAKGFEVKKDNILDVAWGEFISKLEYKAERAGNLIIKVDPRNTSRTCSCCGHIQHMTLADRIFKCESCGFTINRDQNSAKIIKVLGSERPLR
jgi:putative transposase